jgi:nucleotide-binding universal stress UspA family protein
MDEATPLETRTEVRFGGGPVVVGYDDSASARAALRWAISCAELTACEIVLVDVLSEVVEWELAALPVDTDARRRERLEDLRTSWSQPLRDAGIPYRTELRTGKPAEEIVSVAAASHASLIAVGMSGRSGLSELWLGGPAHRLVHDAPCPVVSVPAPRA